jgi:hypothetical protein
MRVIAVAGDAGGARAVLPVIRVLRERGADVECRAYAAASAIWDAAGLTLYDPRSLEVDRADRLLLGTTVGPAQLELDYIRIGAERRVPAVSIVDAWVSYRARYASRDGTIRWPDRIAVADDEMRAGLLADGAPADRVITTGQPAFDELAALTEPSRRGAVRERIRLALDVAADESLIVFASQPLHQLYTPDELGFDDRGIAFEVASALADVIAARSRRGVLAVKLHPREMADPPRETPATRESLRVVRLADDRLAPPRELVAAADLVVGMSSILLVEACLVGTTAVSYQPGLRVPDPLPTNRRGWTRAVTSQGDLRDALDGELFDPATILARTAALAGARVDGGAAGRVADLVMAHYPR